MENEVKESATGAEEEVFSAGWEDETGGIEEDGRPEEVLPAGEPEKPEESPKEEPAEPEIAPERIDPADSEARRQDTMRFVREFPGVSAGEIPREVWARVMGGESLVTAYMRHELGSLREENKRLVEELEREKRASSNRAMAAGSQRTAGAKESKYDPFEEGWGSYEK